MNASEARKASEESVQTKLQATVAQFEARLADAVGEGKLFLEISMASEVFPFFKLELNQKGFTYKDISLLPGLGLSVYLRVSW